jgi:dissimilatory sulfite reductase (desulfoviridin) alpha/beta subunit
MPSDAYVLETCRGASASGCRCALPLPEDFVAAMQELVARMPEPEALSALGRSPRHHERFRLALCACPNGCAKPHVADLGIVAFRAVTVATEACSGCGACVQACPDGAVRMEGDIAVVDPGRCLGCGKCAAVCPQGAMLTGPVELRAMLGGRLGRRPRLGQELPERLDAASALSMAERCLDAYGRQMRPGIRFADILSPGGRPGLPPWVWL